MFAIKTEHRFTFQKVTNAAFFGVNTGDLVKSSPIEETTCFGQNFPAPSPASMSF